MDIKGPKVSFGSGGGHCVLSLVHVSSGLGLDEETEKCGETVARRFETLTSGASCTSVVWPSYCGAVDEVYTRVCCDESIERVKVVGFGVRGRYNPFWARKGAWDGPS